MTKSFKRLLAIILIVLLLAIVVLSQKHDTHEITGYFWDQKLAAGPRLTSQTNDLGQQLASYEWYQLPSDQFENGDYVQVTYRGAIMESYPMQFQEIIAVEKLPAGE